ncbi:PQQ-dependent sugar dehydrogenase [uncultured Sunxiuqinia sp.]|uniref:PQQ-dependent sugar dehydrogenase n=1 Tax=uncultured Sunxiuqinia sp. TaxID=1573825 RepID=UPI0026300B1A|nr:PQQ-dependent sugar dehydrogenase [uncultured Sunxiuqinia sp.]
MKNLLFSTFVSSFIFIFYSCQSPNGQELYKTHCAGCHGLNLEGTSSGVKLLNPHWKNEEGRDYIRSTVKFGIPSTTMISWEKALTNKEVDAITNYLIETQGTQEAFEVNTEPETIETNQYTLKIEKIVVEHLTTPWGIEFVNSDSALISEKKGRLKWLIQGKLDTSFIEGLPKPHLASSTGGFMDIALDPDFDENRWIYLAYSHTNGHPKDKEALGMTKIVRGKISNNHWQQEQTLFEVPDSQKVVHGDRWGCRLLFDREGLLYFSIGDMGRAKDSQKLNKPSGKVFRIHPDGAIPIDNPFVDTPNALPAIYTLGNRNTQGLALHPQTGAIWSTDHGPQGGDELNILQKGANYGWPVITHGIGYNGEVISRKNRKKGMEQPVVQWTPSIAVCPTEFVTSPLFPKWHNNLLLGGLAFQELRRLELRGEKVRRQEILLKGMGRIRDLKFGPNGQLYVLTNSPDRVLQIVPQ